MISPKEAEILLKLFKEFNRDYNANSISKEIKITPRGALKALKNLEKKEIVISKPLGKAIFYKVNLNDPYTTKILETILIGETKEKASRWLMEFNDLLDKTEIIILFGSVIRNQKYANDIDLLIVLKKQEYKKIKGVIGKKNQILPKPVHPIYQTKEDLIHNLKKENQALLSAINTGYVLTGHDKLIEVIKNVTRH